MDRHDLSSLFAHDVYPKSLQLFGVML